MFRVNDGIELSKRTYLGGVVYKKPCPKCGTVAERDFGEQYLMYPVTGNFEEFFLYCEECNHEWKAAEIAVTMVAQIKEIADD